MNEKASVNLTGKDAAKLLEGLTIGLNHGKKLLGQKYLKSLDWLLCFEGDLNLL